MQQVLDAKLDQLIGQKLGPLIDPKLLSQAKETSVSFGVPLGQVLLDKSLVDYTVLGEVMAEYYGVSFVDLKKGTIPPGVLGLITEEQARKNLVIAFARKDQELDVAISDPKNFEIIDLISKKTGLNIKPFFAFDRDILSILHLYKGSLKQEFQEIIDDSVKKTANLNLSLEEISKELPVITILDTLVEYAIAEKTSDIHIEAVEDNVVIRFRIDGILHDMISLPKTIEAAIVARVKVLANLKIDEHRLPQDGRFKFTTKGYDVALRVSILPSFYGENVVMRLLPESERPKTLEELGFTGINLETIKRNIIKSHGMVLVTGPTGSGKTTTLYSLLNILNSPEVKICTVEDPIEYGIRRISQIQVNTKTGLTFAEGLRSLLRHDPDIIMVGEIRDKETASIAINSALTGHLVLSTLHTNDAPSAIPRFLDLGIEGFLLASTFNVILAQRLVRLICKNCIKEVQPNPELLQEISKEIKTNIVKLNQLKSYQGQGCEKCHQSGYSGRIGIYELFEADDEIRELILTKATVSKIKQAAFTKGMTTMLQDGLDKVSAGLTTLDEILRSTRE